MRINKSIKKHESTIMIIFLISAIVFLVILTAKFEIGAHNSDLAQNMRILEEKFGVELADTMSDFSTRDYTEIYILGENQQKESHYQSIFVAMIVGACLMYIAQKVEKKK